MTQFDETTERKATEHERNKYRSQTDHDPYGIKDSFEMGRNSAKESLEILARALELVRIIDAANHGRDYTSPITEAIAAVKARNDWPLPEDK